MFQALLRVYKQLGIWDVWSTSDKWHLNIMYHVVGVLFFAEILVTNHPLITL